MTGLCCENGAEMGKHERPKHNGYRQPSSLVSNDCSNENNASFDRESLLQVLVQASSPSPVRSGRCSNGCVSEGLAAHHPAEISKPSSLRDIGRPENSRAEHSLVWISGISGQEYNKDPRRHHAPGKSLKEMRREWMGNQSSERIIANGPTISPPGF